MEKEYRNFDEERNKKNRGIFYATVSIITLIVAIIGASFSYFIASASSDSGAVNTGSTAFSLEYNDNFQHLLNQDLIPADNNVVYYSSVIYKYANSEVYRQFSENPLNFDKKANLAETKCRDQNGNAVCSLYTFSVTNPESIGVDQSLKFRIQPIENTFGNLYLMVLDPTVIETNTEDLDAFLEAGVKSGVVINEFHLGDENLKEDDTTGDYYYDLDGMNVTLASGESKSYELVLYIKNLKDEKDDQNNVIVSGDQTEADANKNFIASVVIVPDNAEGSGQIYGVIANASGKFTD